MKRTVKFTSFLLALVLALSMFTACELNFEEILGQLGGTPGVVIKDMVTIQWVQGQKVLKEEIVEKGSKLTPWTPECEGMEFQGWYERPYIKRFDFDRTTADESMRIYAYFKAADGSDDSGSGEIDASIWYLIGAGKGDLGKCNNWNHEAAAKNVSMKLGEDGLYSITLNLYAGDQFKMTRNLGWDEEKAIDIMAGYSAEDGNVKDENGTVVFTAGENNNIVVAEGQDGKYEITYDEANNVMSFKFIEALESLPDDIRLIGDFNGWSTTYGEEDYKFTSTDNENWTFTWEVSSPTTFKVYNNLSGVYYPGGMGNDLSIQAGTYTVYFNSTTREIVVKDSDGNEVDVGFTNDGGNDGGDTPAVTPNANPVDKIYVVLNSNWNDGSKMGAWTWPGDQWADLVPTEDPNVYEVNIPTGANQVIFVDFNAEATDYNWDDKREQTGDLVVPDQSDDKIYYHISTGAWTNSPEETDDGGNTGGNGPALTETITVYFENNWLWTNVSCHYWGDEGFVGTEWPGKAMNVVGTRDGHDVYAIEIPVGVTGFLFTGNKDTEPYDLDQSPDISTAGLVNGQGYKMLYVEGTGNTVEGFTYDPNGEADATAIYTVAGVAELCGTGWDTTNTANDMEYDAEAGVYKKVYTGLATGSYEFKIVKDHSWDVNWGVGGQGGANFVAEVLADGSTVTITFDGTNVTYTVE